MIPSLSIFVLYLGINEYLKILPNPGTNVWFLPHYRIEDLYLSARDENAVNLAEYYMVRVSPDKKTILAFVNASFKNKSYWINNKKELMESFVRSIEKNTIPSLSDHIVYKDAASPYTLYRYTLNYKGAAYGWAGILSQFADPDFKTPSFVKGLYLTGHWTTYAQGIPGVAYLGYDIANIILRHKKINI
jgi:phytoene dehydrogenase-like protein